jgi:hypothetical protein
MAGSLDTPSPEQTMLLGFIQPPLSVTVYADKF